MKIAKRIGKLTAILFGMLIITGLVLSCQSTGSTQSAGGVKRDSEAVKAYERGDALYKKGALKEAIAEFTKAIEIEPAWAEAFIMRGYVHGWDDALEFAINDYESAAKIDRKYRDFAQGARYYFVDKDYTKAIEIFNKVIQNKIFLFIVYTLRGNCYHETGEFQKAIVDYTEAIKLNPDFYGNYSNRAYAYNQTGQFDKAIADCNKAINLYPENFYGYFFRGDAYYGKKDYSRALLDYGQAIKLKPDFAVGYQGRGFSYYRLENYQNAIDDFTKFIEILFATEDVHYSLYLLRGHSHFMLGNYDKASADIDIVLKRDPGNEDALWIRGEIRAARAAQ